MNIHPPHLPPRLSDLLLAGAIMNQVLQPHEAHIPFPLQVRQLCMQPRPCLAYTIH